MNRCDLVGYAAGCLLACGTASGGIDVASALRDVASGGRVSLETIGTSAQGRELVMARVGDPASGRGVLVVAGLHPHHGVGVETAVGVIRSLEGMEGDLDDAVVYVLPLANPDGFEWLAREGTPLAAFGGTVSPDDADRDGRVDEDGPVDLNGDGVVSLMRVEMPAAWTGLHATHIEDPELTGFMREADVGDGETARYAVLPESEDADGDGRFGEDGPFGVSPDRNFPYQWPEFEDDAGPYQLSTPEALALATWLMAHPEVRVVVTYGPHDTLAGVPTVGKYDQTGAVPLGIEQGDEAVYKAVGARFRELTGITEAGATPSNAGSFHGWAYGHLGLHSFATPVWVRPDRMKQPESEEDAEASDDAEDGAEAPGADGPWAPPKGVSDEAAWWSYLREVRAGDGIVEWSPFEHPQLGPVEIGGVVPGHRFDVPEGELPGLIDGQAAFVGELVSSLARVEEDIEVASLGGGLWRVDLRVRNAGRLPTRSAMGSKARREPPMVFVMDVPDDRLVSGDRLQRIDRLEGYGDARDLSWIVRGGSDDSVQMRVRLPGIAERITTVSLTEGAGR